MNFNRHGKKIWWILAAAWCIFIFMQSQQTAVESGGKSAFVLDIVNNVLNRLPDAAKFSVNEFFIRKPLIF